MFRLTLPPSQRNKFEGRPELLFTYDAHRYDAAAENDLEFAAPGHRFFRWLIEQAITAGVIQIKLPLGESESLPAITARLYAAYTVDGGTVRVAGCSLEERWVVELCRHESAADENSAPQVVLIGPDCRELREEQREQLGISAPVNSPPAAIPPDVPNLVRSLARSQPSVWNQFVSAVRQLTPAIPGEGATEADTLPDLASLTSLSLYCPRWVTGKLRFTCGSESLDASFSGWAHGLQPQPLECPRTGRSTFHLAMTDDQRMAAFESIASCDKTGCRALETELVCCELSGSRVLAEFARKCAASGKLVLVDSLVECPRCKQQVSPQALTGSRCDACRRTDSVRASDARIAVLVDEYPGLERWGKWRLAETDETYIATARRYFRRILLVVDKVTLQVNHIAQGGLRPGWTTVGDPEDQAAILGLGEATL